MKCKTCGKETTAKYCSNWCKTKDSQLKKK